MDDLKFSSEPERDAAITQAYVNWMKSHRARHAHRHEIGQYNQQVFEGVAKNHGLNVGTTDNHGPDYDRASQLWDAAVAIKNDNAELRPVKGREEPSSSHKTL